jgi:hypothetical protein
MERGSFFSIWASYRKTSWLQNLAPIPLQNVGTVTGNLAGLVGGVQYCRASRKLLADSE